MRETISTKKKKKSANKTKTKTKQKNRNQNNNKKPQAPASQPGNTYHVLEVNIDHSHSNIGESLPAWTDVPAVIS